MRCSLRVEASHGRAAGWPPIPRPTLRTPVSRWSRTRPAGWPTTRSRRLVRAGSRAPTTTRLALTALLGAAALGPGGQGILAALGILFGNAAIPDTRQLEAVGWLILLTLPLAGWCFVVAAAHGNSLATVLVGAGVVAYVAGAFLAATPLPAQLGDLYCYAAFTSEGVEYQKACRAFDALGFLHASKPYLGSPSGSGKIAEWALVYLADARGSAMALAGAVAGAAMGYLTKRQLTS